ncbi:hypothetical protein A2733_01200 [Candidatus Nomurabacteria bacterium RIFCSPHIGHO2_01_FULL_40_20]|uniref:VTT domain-containing protein n=1 Tax=Candidatus Nomurabacteria bacterium RIFCSPHIGHO2_01_FULL_40_20 TaxID=1801738 RepID=A0A1F6V4L8_9BACT|nr:MAG: hypothetical protein A2733_01200 [Candidatus Nomurabacteria bacterium RIFCSPHIGHO2_01_FULL_40_20]
MEAQEIINQIGALSYFGVWLLSFAANVLVPIPEEGVFIILGYLAGGPHLNGLILFPVIFTGVIASDITIYLLARGGNRFITGAYKRIFASQVESRMEWVQKNINKVIFCSRFLIQLRFLGPFLAGYLKIPFKKFLLLDAGALLIYIPLYLALGWYFRSRIDSILNGIGVARNIILMAILLGLVFLFMKYIRKKYAKMRL